jgi:UDP-2,3-diacylglucosamine pyrophosphatase LpxH
MRIAVISDLHLGAGDAAERCVHRDETLLSWLDELEASHERILLLGDIWETLTDPTRPGASRRMLDRARRAHASLAGRFERPAYIHFCGNHDPVTREYGAREQLVWDHGGDRYLFVHGDVLDSSVETQWLCTAGVYLGGWLLRMGWENAFMAFEDYAARSVDQPAAPASGFGMSAPSRAHLHTPYRQAALDLARSMGADVIVTGHTHKASVHATGSGLYLNSGSVLNHEVTWLSLDTAHGRSELHRRVLTDPNAPCLREHARRRTGPWAELSAAMSVA